MAEISSKQNCDCYFVQSGTNGLDSVLINQIDADLDYFCNGAFIYFCPPKYNDSTNLNIEISSYPNPFSPSPAINIDNKLQNYFALVFTNHDSNNIVGYILQTKEATNTDIVVMWPDIDEILTLGKYDIYVFHNSELLVKDSYAYIGYR